MRGVYQSKVVCRFVHLVNLHGAIASRRSPAMTMYELTFRALQRLHAMKPRKKVDLWRAPWLLGIVVPLGLLRPSGERLYGSIGKEDINELGA